MTPSEIADWLDGFVVDEADYDPRIIHKAAATIRAQAEALKIATEALERIGYTQSEESGLSLAECVAASRQALARIKEVG